MKNIFPNCSIEELSNCCLYEQNIVDHKKELEIKNKELLQYVQMIFKKK